MKIRENLLPIFFISISIWFASLFILSSQENGIGLQKTEAQSETKPVVIATSTSKQTKKFQPTRKNTPAIPSISPQTAIIETPPKKATDFSSINDSARKAVVNILCSTNGTELSPISGSGVLINPRGIILTNAHIGQYWLLKDFHQKDSVQCQIRTGSPAYPKYNAELMYISSRWVGDNPGILKDLNPKGTGERDFAFLHITGMVDGSNLPNNFPFIPPNTSENFNENEPVILVSYPAGFLGGMTILQNLNITSAITTIQKIYTFKENTSDLISVGGTVVSQKGSSGGAVIDGDNTLIGIISTESTGTTTSQTDLFAVTLSHIDRILKEETNGGLSDLLSQDPSSVTQIFQNTIQSTLTKLITDKLNR